MPASSSEFALLYRIQALGLDQLDGIAQKNQQIDLSTKYSAASLRQFDAILKAQVSTAGSYRSALDQISKSTQGLGAEHAKIAKDIIANDKAMQRSKDDNARASAREAQQEQQNANRIFQTRMRLWQQTQQLREQEARQQQSAQQNLMSGASRTLGLGTMGTNFSRGVSGMMGGVGANGMMAGGLLALGGVGAATALFDQFKDAAKDAQALTTLANELGVSTQRMFQLQSAAKLTGQDLGNVQMAASRLAEAIEAPGEQGKKAADALTSMGVSLRGGAGQAFDSFIQQLQSAKTHEEAVAKASEVLGTRMGAKFVEIADSMKSLGPSMDAGLIQNLTEANRKMEDLSIKWQVLKADLLKPMSSVIDIAYKITNPNIDEEAKKRGEHYGPAAPPMPSGRYLPQAAKGAYDTADPSKLRGMMTSPFSLESLEERITQQRALVRDALHPLLGPAAA